MVFSLGAGVALQAEATSSGLTVNGASLDVHATAVYTLSNGVKRLAVRFAKNVFPGNDVVTSIYEVSPGVYAFEATSNGETVISNGRAEIE